MQRPPSRFHTARRMAAGMCRVVRSFPLVGVLGSVVAANVQLAAAHGGEDLGVTTGGPGGRDAFVRDALGEAQDALAVREQRRAAFLDVEPARVDLGEVGEQLGLDGVSAPDELMEAGEQLAPGKCRERSVHGVDLW